MEERVTKSRTILPQAPISAPDIDRFFFLPIISISSFDTTIISPLTSNRVYQSHSSLSINSMLS